MNVTICEFPDEARHKEEAWAALTEHCAAEASDLVVLPEMPFCDWKTFMQRKVEPDAWREALAAHDEMLARMHELGAATVLGSGPARLGEQRFNRVFVWTAGGVLGSHCKYYLPDEPDGWEATWFDRGDRDFAPIEAAGLEIGFQICTELLFSDISREIGRAGAHLIAAPRATSGHRRWRMAACMAAIMAGCFVACANRRSDGDKPFPGASWLVSPEGEVLAETGAESPFRTVAVDFADADAAKQAYPRNLYIS